MKRSYSTNLTPPGMVLSIRVGATEGHLLFTVEATLDTGASMTALPQELLQEHGIKPEGRVRVSGAFDKERAERPTFFVKIQPGTGPILDVEVLARPKHTALLGRDVLNDCILLADGPQQQYELTFGNAQT